MPTSPSRSLRRATVTAVALAMLLPGAAAAQPADRGGAGDGTPPAVRPAETTGRAIVTLRDGADARRAAPDIERRARSGGAPDAAVDHVGDRLGTVVLGAVPDGAMRGLRNHPDVVHVEREVLLTRQLSDTLQLVGAPTAHADGSAGSGAAVAVIDTGVDRTHPALATAVTHEGCFVTPSSWNGSSTCPDGSSVQVGTGAAVPCAGSGCSHGTHVAGIAAGRPHGGQPGGVAPAASIIAVQVFGDNGGGASSGDITAALDWLLQLRESGVPVAAVNLSLGGGLHAGTCDYSGFHTAVQRLRDAGVLTVAASGNEGARGEMSWPACTSNVFSVAASTKSDGLASFSNVSSETDVIAPGTSVVAPVVGGGYGGMSGTSMATPHVAGAVAALRGRWNASPAAIEATLRETGPTITTSVKSLRRLDLAAANGRPGRVSSVAATHGDRRVTVTWPAADRDGSSAITGYRVRVSDGGPTVNVSASTRSVTITGLTNGTRHTVDVRAVNRFRPGSYRTSHLVIPKPAPAPHGFPDVPSSSYFEHPVRWLKAEGITDGVGKTGKYMPRDTVTRAQMAAFLWRMHDEPTGYPHHGFPDVPSGAYYDQAVRWLKAVGVTDGVGGTGLYKPGDRVTRAQMAAFLWRAAGEPTGYPHHGFPDVPSGAYYDQAVRWLKAEGITDGVGTTGKYLPGDSVTRAQMAAFLSRKATAAPAWKDAARIPNTIAF